MSVYFMRPIGFDGPIKIGYSSQPDHRRQALMLWSPFPLEIVAVDERYGAGTENRLHEAFAADRLHFEWFTVSPRLTRLMDAVRGGADLHDAMTDEGIPTLSPYALRSADAFLRPSPLPRPKRAAA